MSDLHDNVDHTFEAVARLRGLLREHQSSGAQDTPFFIGIREALEELDAYGERDQQSAA
jgi:hypothetical protein